MICNSIGVINIFCNIYEALEELRNGKILCISDREDIEDEIDMMCLADFATTENINYMISNAKGLVCLSAGSEIIDNLGLKPLKYSNIDEDKLGTPFFQPLDLNNGSTGVSAEERGKTARHIASGKSKLSDFISPGHLQILRAKPRLLAERLGHTEFSVQMADLCEHSPAAVICEIIDNQGQMLRVKDFEDWNKDKNLKLFSIDQLINFNDEVQNG